MIKMLFFLTVPASRDLLLVMDADVLWCNDVDFVDPTDGVSLQTVGGLEQSWSQTRRRAEGGNGYMDFIHGMLGGVVVGPHGLVGPASSATHR